MSSSHRETAPIHDLPRWESWVEQAISEAQERGDFDNLPGRGQRLAIEENREAGDWEMAYHLLKNAEMSPPWMELNREVQAETAALAEIRDRYCRSLAAVDTPPRTTPDSGQGRRPWWAFWRTAPAVPAAPDPALVRDARIADERRARRDYLAQAARLDEVLAAYNAWLPNDLRRLTRPRMTPARAAREWDAPCKVE